MGLMGRTPEQAKDVLDSRLRALQCEAARARAEEENLSAALVAWANRLKAHFSVLTNYRVKGERNIEVWVTPPVVSRSPAGDCWASAEVSVVATEGHDTTTLIQFTIRERGQEGIVINLSPAHQDAAALSLDQALYIATEALLPRLAA
jgi:hypothetical protein